MNDLSPSALFDMIRSRSTEAVIGQSGLNHTGLAAAIRRRFASTDAALGGLVQEPVIEAAPGYVQHDATMEQLSGSLLHPATIAALDRDDAAYRFKREWHPYRHQVQAWTKLAEKDKTNSVLVTSGTGSGKTECFLVPILDDLARQSASGMIAEGVKPSILYPLNA